MVGSAHAVVADVIIIKNRRRVLMRVWRLLLAVETDAKVAENHVARCGEENVLWLDVSVDDTVGMEVLDGQNDFCDVETRFILLMRFCDYSSLQ